MNKNLPEKTGKKQAAGKFLPGASGNPSGRPVGSRNKVSIMLDGILEDKAQELMDKAIQRALAGNTGMLKMLINKIIPDAKERPADLRLPVVKDESDTPAIALAMLASLASGDLLPGEIAPFIKLVELFVRSKELEREAYNREHPFEIPGFG